MEFDKYGSFPEMDRLVDSQNSFDRRDAAEHEYALDILVYDDDWRVRRAVARQGYRLDILVNDKDWLVRQAVAKQGHGLDVLIHDNDELVRYSAIKKLIEKYEQGTYNSTDKDFINILSQFIKDNILNDIEGI